MAFAKDVELNAVTQRCNIIILLRGNKPLVCKLREFVCEQPDWDESVQQACLLPIAHWQLIKSFTYKIWLFTYN